MHSISKRYEFIQHIAREAGKIAHDYYLRRDELIIECKGDAHDYVSIADKNVEKFIRDHIKSEFPNDAILGEEHGIEGNVKNGIWVIDPIDGTSNFLRGIDLWTTTIAWMSDQETQIGVTYNPITDKLYHAMKGQGAWLENKKLLVDSTTETKSSTVVVGGFRGCFEDSLRVIKSLHSHNIKYRRYGSASISLIMVAEGAMDGYIEYNLNSWDAMAGVLIVKEAGSYVYSNWDESNLLELGHVATSIPRLKDIMLENLT